MYKTIVLALGAGLLATAALQFPGTALAAQKGSERGVIAIGGPFPGMRPGDSRGIIVQRKTRQLENKNTGGSRGIIIYDKNKGVGDPNQKVKRKGRLHF